MSSNKLANRIKWYKKSKEKEKETSKEEEVKENGYGTK